MSALETAVETLYRESIEHSKSIIKIQEYLKGIIERRNTLEAQVSTLYDQVLNNSKSILEIHKRLEILLDAETSQNRINSQLLDQIDLLWERLDGPTENS